MWSKKELLLLLGFGKTMKEKQNINVPSFKFKELW